MFERRHYEAIAATIRGIAARANEQSPLTEEDRADIRGVLVNPFADMLERDDPRFNRARFVEACER